MRAYIDVKVKNLEPIVRDCKLRWCSETNEVERLGAGHIMAAVVCVLRSFAQTNRTPLHVNILSYLCTFNKKYNNQHG